MNLYKNMNDFYSYFWTKIGYKTTDYLWICHLFGLVSSSLLLSTALLNSVTQREHSVLISILFIDSTLPTN